MHKFLLFIIVISSLACGDVPVYEETQIIPNGIWSYDESREFNFTIDDATAKYNLFLDIDHSINFPFENLYLKVSTSFPDNTSVTDTLSVEMMDATSRWAGKCGGEDCDLRVFLQENTKFKESGNYTLNFEQFTRESSLRGVTALSFRIEKS